MEAKFIPQPISGEYEEFHFGDTSSNNSWVKFSDDDLNEWAASFAQGWGNVANKIIKLKGERLFFIIAQGRGYLIDSKLKAKIGSEDITGITSAVADELNDKVYFSNSFDLKSIDSNGIVEVLFDYYFFDDIELIEVRDNKLYARYWHYQSSNNAYRIEIDLISKEVRDSFYDLEKNSYSPINPNPSFIERIIKKLRT